MEKNITTKLYPQRRYQVNGRTITVGIQLTVAMEGRTKEEKEKLNEIWEQLEKDDSPAALLKIVQDCVAGDRN